MDPKHLILLYQDEDEGRILETDVMRFMAIIGIILWMVFALVKSLPFQETKSSEMKPQPGAIAKKQTPPLPPTPPVKTPEPDKPHAEPAPLPSESVAPPAPLPEPAREQVREPSPPTRQKVLTVNFSSIEALEKLMRAEKVVIFFETRSSAFNLLYKSVFVSGALTFEGIDASHFPGSLWEITSGVEYSHFNQLLKKSAALAKSSDEQHLYVHFMDKEIEHHVETTISTLSQQKRYGKIRIHADGSIQFYEND